MIQKVKESESYEFMLVNKRYVVDVGVFRKVLDIYPRNEGEEFAEEYELSIPETMLNVDITESKSYQRFLLYSIGSIPSKKSRGKGSQGKKTGDTAEENVLVFKKSDPEPFVRKKTSRRSIAKKKPTISDADNIVLDPDLALELGKSIILTKAEEEAVARQVHANHARIVSQKLKGIQTLTPEEQKAANIINALKESRKTSKRQPGTGGSDEGNGMIPRVPDESTGSNEESERSDKDADAEKDDEETEFDYEDIYKYKIKVCKDTDEEMKDADNVESENKENE
nr:hypothetical protein [Tanacetum cinerariifolium]